MDWEQFKAENWTFDMTPSMHWTTMVRLIPLEIFLLYGLFNEEFYTRYFYNETEPEFTDAEAELIYKTKYDTKNFYDLDTESGKREFEKDANNFVSLYPGSVVKEGETIDFRKFYAQNAIMTNADTSKYD